MREAQNPSAGLSSAKTKMDDTTIPPQAALHTELRHSTDAPFLTNDNIATNPSSKKQSWWKSATCYQVWPASFKDSNDDGIGDLQGILSKLDYLHDLGIDCIWLSPMFASPQKDMGYDISDYEAIDPTYGTMSDMDELIAGCHNRGMRLLLDLVVNHTSDEHKWFKESCKGKAGDGKFGDFYIWKDAKMVEGKRTQPNNWGSVFGGPAWEWCEERGQYYLHIFTKEQPDLNWEIDEVRATIRESAMHFWFKKGIDGFRVDTSNIYSKDQSFPDGETDERFSRWGNPGDGIRDGPRMHEWWKEIRREVLDQYGDPMMVGELGGADFDAVMKYVSSEERELSCIFDFDYTTLGSGFTNPPHEVKGYKLPEAKTALQKIQDLVMTGTGWGTTWKENHDMPRSVSRHGTNNPEYWERAAKLLCIMTTALSGTIFLYQGEEIGMTNIPESWSVDDLKDVSALNYYRELEKNHPDDKELLKRAWKGIVAIGRDNARTPVQWSNEKHAGFSTAQPWMRVNDNYKEINVAKQMKSSDSVLGFWKSMLQIRKQHANLLVHGSYKVHDFENELSWTFEKRSKDGGFAVVLLNFSEQECDLRWPEGSNKSSLKLVMTNVKEPSEKLQPWEGRLYTQK